MRGKRDAAVGEEHHTTEEKVTLRKRRKRNWGLILPETGVIGPDGNPFYHHSVANLRKEHYKRIEECGLRLIHGKFSATEDRRIRKNWRRFAREHNLTDEDVWKFLPARYRRSVLRESLRGSSMEKMIFEEDFWCKMCRKLDGRVGRQVLTRMCTIFNPFYLSGESSRPWTSADDDELMDLMRMHGRDYPLIAFELRRTITSVKNRLNYLLDNRVRPLIPHGNVLLDCVCRVAGLSNIFSGIAENFDFSTLNWEKVAKLADSNEDASKLRKRFFKKKLPYSMGLFELFDGNCRSAIRCMTQDEQFSARDEAIAVIPLLMEHNPKALKDIDLEKFKQQLVDIGYFRNSTEATKKCSLIIHRLGYRINKLTEKRLHVQLTFKEKLRVLLEAYKDPTYSLRKHSILVLKKATSLVQNIVGRKV